jgi:hypothetical protein
MPLPPIGPDKPKPRPNYTGTCYLTIVPDPRYANRLRVHKATSGRPIVNLAGAAVIKIALSVPPDVFNPPAIDVFVPADHASPGSHITTEEPDQETTDE